MKIINIHKWIRQNLEDYFNGDLDIIETKRIEKHFKKCKKCQKIKDEYFIDRITKVGLGNIFPEPSEEELKYTHCFSDITIKEYVHRKLNLEEEKIIEKHLYIDDCDLCNSKVDACKEFLQKRSIKALIEKMTSKIYQRCLESVKAFPNIKSLLQKPITSPVLSFKTPVVKILPIRVLKTPVLVSVIVIISVCLAVPFLTSPLQLKSFNLVSSPITTRGQNRFKISLVTNHDCYAYLFEIKEDKINPLFQEERVIKKTENIIPSDEQKWIQKEGVLILFLSKKPLINISVIEDLIIKNYEKGEEETLKILKKELKGKTLLIKFLPPLTHISQ